MEDGGSAFPQVVGKWHNLDYSEGNHQHEGGEFETTGGMSLRDWFAGMALAGMLADASCVGGHSEYTESAYKYADEMIAKRKESKAQ